MYVAETSATLTQDDFQVQAATGGVLSAQMVSTLEGAGRATVQNGPQHITVDIEDLDALLALVTAVAERTRLYRQSVTPEAFTPGS